MALETPENDELLLSDQIPPRDFQLPSPQLHQVNNYTIKLYRNVVLFMNGWNSVCLQEDACLVCVICVCLRIMVHTCPTHNVLCFSFVFLRLVYTMLTVSLDYHYLIAPSVFSNVYSQPVFSYLINMRIRTTSLGIVCFK